MSETPSMGQDSLLPSVLELVSAVCNRFEEAWLAGRRPRIEDYLGYGPEERERDALLKGLIDLDVFFRRRQREIVDASDYQKRFPSLPPDWLAGTVTMAYSSPDRYCHGHSAGNE